MRATIWLRLYGSDYLAQTTNNSQPKLPQLKPLPRLRKLRYWSVHNQDIAPQQHHLGGKVWKHL